MSAAAKSDGWIEWAGGECPVDGDTPVFVKFRDGSTDEADIAGNPAPPCRAVFWSASRMVFDSWQHNGRLSDIIAYRLVKP